MGYPRVPDVRCGFRAYLRWFDLLHPLDASAIGAEERNVPLAVPGNLLRTWRPSQGIMLPVIETHAAAGGFVRRRQQGFQVDDEAPIRADAGMMIASGPTGIRIGQAQPVRGLGLRIVTIHLSIAVLVRPVVEYPLAGGR